MRLSNPDEGVLYERVETIAVTGTRNGMSDKQRKSFKWLLKQFPYAKELVHGDCVGVDEEAGEIADELGMKVLQRPSNLKTRAWSKVGEVIAEPKDPLKRNEDIVNQGDCTIGCPKGMKEERRSGTWAAIRYARSVGTLLWIIWPDGSVTGPLD